MTGVEPVAAITRKGLLLSPADADAATATLRTELAGLFQIVEVTATLLDGAMGFSEKHALRGYDAVQPAAAMEAHEERARHSLPPLVLVTADDELLAAGAAEGLAVENPNDH